MATELKVPPVGESITEVVVGEWIKPKGAYVGADEPVVTLETDKVNIDLPAPVGGVVIEVLKAAGATAKVGEVIGYMEAKDAPAGPGGAKGAGGAKATAPAQAVVEAVATTPSAPAGSARPVTEPGSGASSPVRLSPSKRRAVRAGEPVSTGVDAVAQPQVSLRNEEIVPMTPLRRRVAERLVLSQQTGALLTTFNEVDLSDVMALRKQHQEAFKKKHGVKLGFMSFFIKAAIEALKELPALNAEIRGTDIVYHDYFDIGVAVGGGKGLVVPVLRNAERLGFAEIEQKIVDFGTRARANRLKLDELTGGTFTISNGGVYGSMLSTPIVNPPQSGILGMHNIQERAVVVDGQIVARPMMYLALTYDHRLVDGREAVTFLVRIKQCLENPSRILLEI